MKLSLTSAREDPTALISRQVCPGCPPAAVAETIPFRLCRRSSGTGATDSGPNGEIPTGRLLCSAGDIDEEHDALQITLYFRTADIIRIRRRRVYLCLGPLALFSPAYPTYTCTVVTWLVTAYRPRLSPNSRRCTSEHMYKYDPASKKIRYVLESDVRVLSILSMSKRVLLHMHEPVDENVPEPILPHMRV